MTTHTDLTQGSVASHILRMAPPMGVAFLAMMGFNLADTWFVSKLGTIPLAAMGFTFPVMMLIHSVAMGLGIGTSSCVSRAIGEGDHDRVQHLATYSLYLGFAVMVVFVIVALVLLKPLLRLIGAGPETMPLATIYLQVLLPFVPLAALPMIGNNAIRATGDTLRPSIIMVTGAVLNIILDPLLIFGPGPFPRMGIAGAALATGISRMLTLAWAVWLLHHRCHLLTSVWAGLRNLFRAWGQVLHVALPAGATNLLMPLTAGIITKIVASFGEKAVAAAAAGQRVEMFAFVVPISMGTTLMPIIGQNWGAKRYGRVREAWFKTNVYGIVYSILILGIALPAGKTIASWFTTDPEVAVLLKHYVWIMLAGAILIHSAVHTTFAFNAIKKPLYASAIIVIRMAGLVIPLAWLGSRLLGVHGVFIGMATAHMLAGLIAMTWFGRFLARRL